jgi:fatty-acyl-CoA synthase
MSYPGTIARQSPERAALIHAGSGAAVSYRALDDGSNRLAQYLHGCGLRRGDHLAVLLENNLRYTEVVWAGLRSGLYVTAINRYLTPDEAAYIVNDCGARAIVSSQAMARVAAALGGLIPGCPARLMMDGAVVGWTSYEAAVGGSPAAPLAEEWAGEMMLYSSGTTGRPKGIRRPLRDVRPDDPVLLMDMPLDYGFHPDMVYLSPAPMYHAAPLNFSLRVQRQGGTVVMMPRFDATEALVNIARYRVTHSQWVPTMFVRMLKLPEPERRAHDLSSLVVAVHAAAPCPVEIKRAMIDWWGPILYEYYAGTEANGITRIDSADWLAHPGSVGRATLGIVRICDDEGHELPAGEAGLIYFERETMPFAYHNDPEKTRRAQHPAHPNWSTLGDIGYLDAEGYLYLTDRKAFMIISGGVNIYPQAIEDALVTHPMVRDAAVFGLPNADLGEEVKAVIEPADSVTPDDALAAELIAYLRTRVARYMVPKSIDFVEQLPRLPTGKLYKHALRAQYLATT